MKTETAGAAGRILVTLLGLSWRIRRLRPETGVKTGSVLFASWHGVQLPLIYTHRNMGIRILISRSSDGSIVSSICGKMGFKPVRGSSSRGGTEAARELMDSMIKGESGGITPDGPRGPARQVKRGVSLIPRRVNLPVVPLGVSAYPAIKLKSWDRFLVPLPFAAVTVAEGRPVLPGECSKTTLKRAIDQQQSRAELAGDLSATVLISLYRAAGYLLTPLVSFGLIFRGETERRERKGAISAHSEKPVWIHGSSLGELKGLTPVIEILKEQGRPIHVTCSTASGRAYLQGEGVSCSLMPLDLPGYVDRFLKQLSPRALILAETEFWPSLLYQTEIRGIPSALINGRLSRKSVRGYRFVKPLFKRIFSCFRTVLTRSRADTERFTSLGVTAETAGDGKTLVKSPEPDKNWRKRINPGRNGILIAGSIRKGEEETFLKIAEISRMTPVLVPRHDDRIQEIVRICEKAGFKPDLWTDEPVKSNCLIVDVKGILSSLYGTGDVAFIGGTIADIGGHNILEPLSQGVPVIAGPRHYNIEDELKRAVANGVCRVFESAQEGASAALDLRRRKGLHKPPSSSDFSRKLEILFEVLELNNATD